MARDIWSPCIKVCLVDPAHRMCVGCFRKLEELGRWTKFTDAEREAVRGQLARREAAYVASRPGSSGPPSPGPRDCGEADACAGPETCQAKGLDCPALRPA